MDPLHYQEILHYSQQGSKLQMNHGGNLIMMPVAQLEAQSPTDLSEHVTTQIITPEQFQQVTSIDSSRIQHGREWDDGLSLGGADECLADLQPEDSDGEEEEGSTARASLGREQKKLEFMAAVDLVPPAVLEDIQRRQKLCRAEYGNWWDRQHSTDFCLVPKNRTVHYPVSRESPDDDHYEEDYPLVVGEDQTQVAAGPDAESTVEQITYLTSWPATTSPAHQTSMDIITMPTTTMSMLSAVGAPVHQSLQQVVEQRRGEEGYQIAFQPVRDYSQH